MVSSILKLTVGCCCMCHWRSQVTDDARALHALLFVFFLGRGEGGEEERAGGMAPLVNFCILEVPTQIVLETIFEIPSVLNRE